MAKLIKFQKGGAIELVKSGFSWPGLFFGCFHLVYRGMVAQFFLWFILAGLTLGIAWFIYPFIANSIYRKYLINHGWHQINRQDA